MRLDFRAFRHLSKRSFWGELWTQINEDHCWGMAAELSYYFLLAFFPFLIFISVIIAALPLEADLLDRILAELNQFLPNRTVLEVAAIVANFDKWRNTQVLFIWITVSLWAASLGLNGMVGVLNRAYRVKDPRSYFRVRGLSIMVTVLVSLFIVVSGFLLFSGEGFSLWLLGRLPLGDGMLFTAAYYFYQVLRWTLIFFFLNIGIQMVYFALPAKRLPWRLLSPGSVMAASGWLLGSLTFSYYVNTHANYQRLYGALGDLVVLMIWFYYSSLLLLVGGEMDSEIFRLRRRRRKLADSAHPAPKPAPREESHSVSG